ncbi:MAG: carbamoyl-phosphate synthase large subunit [Oscillospiraceae bacterium]|jgi:carbamoyl-phosphate synthase large subunit|nr:carbamoyl-phosphate synthase large subunit [Oscillospiraceae bacterium]
MPLRKGIQKVLVIGSGPIVIGQAAEFDYAGTQACRALREEGLEIVLINSNPATIMTDQHMADKIYIEPLTVETVKRIILKEKPDSVLPTLGGQTGLTLAMQLAREGFLKRNNVQLLGARPETIDKAEDRQMFKDTMLSIGQPCIPSKVVTDVESAVAFAETIGYPVIVRPAFTLGGAGGGFCACADELRIIAAGGLRLSPITQILIEKSVAGWKEIEYEVMRDALGNVITVCSMENFDPVGIHTGDSIVVAPTLTLADKEYQMLRTAALDIISALGVEGGCNVQFALHPTSYEYAVIEVNPRVSRSSALASKATGYPIAKVAAKIAIGYTLDEIPNAVTGKTMACFEPVLDYIALKFPKWPFDKFIFASRKLGTQMKATGEVMSLGNSFEHALMKAVRGAEISRDTLRIKKWIASSTAELLDAIAQGTDERLFQIFELMWRGTSTQTIHDVTLIDNFFLDKLQGMCAFEKDITNSEITPAQYKQAKAFGYPDKALARITGVPESRIAALQCGRNTAAFRMVDTCAGEFDAATPYFYSVPEGEDESAPIPRQGKERVVVLGSGPIRIGQGIEFDYASVHCVHALKKLGYETIIINNNPETVSTDFDTADRLYFEALTPEDTDAILKVEKPIGVVAAFGGQTAIKLAKFLHESNYPMLGTGFEGIDAAEDRERFDALLEKVQVKRPAGDTVMTTEEALAAANTLGYPVLVRPSYVLGGQNMSIANNDDEIREFMEIILSTNIENPVLVDKYLMGTEIEVDAICDGKDILIPGIMEHIERTGVHSGDSIAVYPAKNVDDEMIATILEATKKISLELGVIGIVNIQYIIYHGELYVIEVNPRASRTVPYISKVSGVPVVELATRCMVGEKLTTMGYGTGLYPSSPYTAVKVPVFSFEKLHGVDTQLGPEMKSTGEALGIGKTLEEALFKGLLAAGFKLAHGGGVLITVRNQDKPEIPDLAKKFVNLGFKLYATEGNAETLRSAGMDVEVVAKIHESNENTATLLESGNVQFVISTSAKGRDPQRDSVKIRTLSTRLGVPCLTSIDTAHAVADALRSRYSEINTELVNITNMRHDKLRLRFTKMEAAGNDYIYFDCFKQNIESPESLAIALSDRHYGVGGDGVILIMPSDAADAKMRMFNLDGSEGIMCGNGIRCVGKYLYDNGYADKKKLTVETLGGVKTLYLHTKEGQVQTVGVDMGKANFSPESLPAVIPESLFQEDCAEGRCNIEVDGESFEMTLVSMGNPHAVLFYDHDTAGADVERIGPKLEFAEEIFPERVNVGFAHIVDSKTVQLRVWERGSGETLACGTGACAAVAAACKNGYCSVGQDIRVQLPGGDLTVNYTPDCIILKGGAKRVFDGTLEI